MKFFGMAHTMCTAEWSYKSSFGQASSRSKFQIIFAKIHLLRYTISILVKICTDGIDVIQKREILERTSSDGATNSQQCTLLAPVRKA